MELGLGVFMLFRYKLLMRAKTSAGLLMYRFRNGDLEIFLAHPGGPFFARKDDGHWTIPKGEVNRGEDFLAAAIREFTEEVGKTPGGDYMPLGSIRQNRGKTVHGWAFEGEWEAERVLKSTLFEMEWPPMSGNRQRFPEVDRAQFFPLPQARKKIKPAQGAFIERLIQKLASRPPVEVPAPRELMAPVAEPKS